MMYPREWEVSADAGSNAGYESRLLAQAHDLYKAKQIPIQVKSFSEGHDSTWADSYTKLLAFNQTQYKRVVSLDSDATVLQPMDELFLLPPAPVAMPRAYWMKDFFLSSQLIVIEPSAAEWKRVEEATDHHEDTDYDMDILNKMYGKSCLVIPHRRYDLLTGEFRHKLDNHESYVGSPNEKWKAQDILTEAAFVHFSDWPLPKPWFEVSEVELAKSLPNCYNVSETEQDCEDRDTWRWFRDDFSKRRQRVCD